jgi:hypothetical protein
VDSSARGATPCPSSSLPSSSLSVSNPLPLSVFETTHKQVVNKIYFCHALRDTKKRYCTLYLSDPGRSSATHDRALYVHSTELCFWFSCQLMVICDQSARPSLYRALRDIARRPFLTSLLTIQFLNNIVRVFSFLRFLTCTCLEHLGLFALTSHKATTAVNSNIGLYTQLMFNLSPESFGTHFMFHFFFSPLAMGLSFCVCVCVGVCALIE